ncbi:MAG: bifunctional pyr operon transcriptional regulator/uracil phosphoribosyltransferase PyrR [Elusimicrobia bacterium]|nr:bifunctional pyr operon transcriptional regulator/uracil phosphoribosyltransferase PyrR [Elusimicrobiota bacterium]
MEKKREIILNAGQMESAIAKLAEDIYAKNSSVANLAFIGIQTRGVNLATRLRAIVAKLANVKEASLSYGTLDITLYRDDISEAGAGIPIIKDTDIPFDIKGKNIILVDDVLYTGRTIRAALNVLSDFGRAQTVQLAVLIDRPGRELPIEANFAAFKHNANEAIQVEFKELDGQDQVIVLK